MSRNSAVSQIAVALILASLIVGGTAGYIVFQPTGNEPIGAGGAPVRVQGNARGTSSTSTISVTMTATPTSGNALVAVIGVYSNPTRTVSSISETNVT